MCILALDRSVFRYADCYYKLST